MSAADQQTDTQLTVLAALMREAIRYDLGTNIAAKVYDHPVMLSELSQQNMPAMSVYSGRSEHYHHASGKLYERRTVVVDYVLDGTTINKRSPRWHALQAVWGSVMAAVWSGKHAAFQSAAAVLDAANLCVNTDVPGRATYSIADRTYPYFRGELFFVSHGVDFDLSTLKPFIEHHTAFDAPSGTFVLSDQDLTSEATAEATAPPLGYDRTALPAYGS